MELKLSALEVFVKDLLFKDADRLIELFKVLALNADEHLGPSGFAMLTLIHQY